MVVRMKVEQVPNKAYFGHGDIWFTDPTDVTTYWGGEKRTRPAERKGDILKIGALWLWDDVPMDSLIFWEGTKDGKRQVTLIGAADEKVLKNFPSAQFIPVRKGVNLVSWVDDTLPPEEEPEKPPAPPPPTPTPSPSPTPIPNPPDDKPWWMAALDRAAKDGRITIKLGVLSAPINVKRTAGDDDIVVAMRVSEVEFFDVLDHLKKAMEGEETTIQVYSP